MTDRRQQWLEILAAERRRRVEYGTTREEALEQLQTELDAMYQRVITATTGGPWSPSGDASIAERLAMLTAAGSVPMAG